MGPERADLFCPRRRVVAKSESDTRLGVVVSTRPETACRSRYKEKRVRRPRHGKQA